MSKMTISDIARQIGVQPSAIRYYERIGLLPAPQRLSGQRRYDSTVLYRLAIIQRARQLGFSLAEIRQLFFGFRDVTRASTRWRTLCQRKLAELDQLMYGIMAVQALLKKLMTKCRCETLDQCGKSMFQNMKQSGLAKPLLRSYRPRRKYPTGLRTS
ncbi:MAG TPA: MerR family transcriptional regulator [Terriglobales bacterium]|nr:MerR family transcriptional regulator [Terriglobales bacterium]